MKKSETQESNERVDFTKMALLEDELHRLEEENGVEAPLKLWQRLGDKYFAWRDNREKHNVNRKTYLWLTILLGWAGGHRFYEKRWKMGLVYLALCWTGFPAAMAIVDWMIALPMKPDENGLILI